MLSCIRCVWQDIINSCVQKVVNSWHKVGHGSFGFVVARLLSYVGTKYRKVIFAFNRNDVISFTAAKRRKRRE